MSGPSAGRAASTVPPEMATAVVAMAAAPAALAVMVASSRFSSGAASSAAIKSALFCMVGSSASAGRRAGLDGAGLTAGSAVLSRLASRERVMASPKLLVWPESWSADRSDARLPGLAGGAGATAEGKTVKGIKSSVSSMI